LCKTSNTSGFHQLIHFCLAAPTHYPSLTLSVTGQRASDQFQLRVPRLAGVNQITAGFHRFGQTRQRAADHRVVGKQFIQPRHHRQRRLEFQRR